MSNFMVSYVCVPCVNLDLVSAGPAIDIESWRAEREAMLVLLIDVVWLALLYRAAIWTKAVDLPS